MNTTDLKNRHYRLTEDTEQNIRAAEMMSKLIGCDDNYDPEVEIDWVDYLSYSSAWHDIDNCYTSINTTEISYSELEGLYKEQYWFGASVEDAKYEDGKNAEDN